MASAMWTAPTLAQPKQHEKAAADAVDKEHGEQGEDEIDGAGDDDVEQDVVHAVAGAAIDLFRIVEEDVDAAPLLQHRQADADEQAGSPDARRSSPRQPAV